MSNRELVCFPTEGCVHVQVLLKAGIIPICAGGGGIPVALSLMPDGTCWRRHGIEAVIDKVASQSLVYQHVRNERSPPHLFVQSSAIFPLADNAFVAAW